MGPEIIQSSSEFKKRITPPRFLFGFEFPFCPFNGRIEYAPSGSLVKDLEEPFTDRIIKFGDDHDPCSLEDRLISIFTDQFCFGARQCAGRVTNVRDLMVVKLAEGGQRRSSGGGRQLAWIGNDRRILERKGEVISDDQQENADQEDQCPGAIERHFGC